MTRGLKTLLSSSQRVTMCSKWFKFNCMNSLKMNLNCNYRMNLQDAECFKFSVASTLQEPPVAKIARPSDAFKYFHLHCLSQDSKRLIYQSPKRLWNLVCWVVWLTSTWLVSIREEELGLYIVRQLIAHRLSLSSDIITGDLEKHPFV